MLSTGVTGHRDRVGGSLPAAVPWVLGLPAIVHGYICTRTRMRVRVRGHTHAHMFPRTRAHARVHIRMRENRRVPCASVPHVSHKCWRTVCGPRGQAAAGGGTFCDFGCTFTKGLVTADGLPGEGGGVRRSQPPTPWEGATKCGRMSIVWFARLRPRRRHTEQAPIAKLKRRRGASARTFVSEDRCAAIPNLSRFSHWVWR